MTKSLHLRLCQLACADAVANPLADVQSLCGSAMRRARRRCLRGND
jgi:hypothetical protein